MPPIYDYECPACGYVKEILHSYNELENPSEETKKDLLCDCDEDRPVMKRVITAPHLANMQGGVSVPESTLLAQKQEQRKTRSRAHFKNDVLPKLKGGERRHFENKFRGTKNVDHEKM